MNTSACKFCESARNTKNGLEATYKDYFAKPGSKGYGNKVTGKCPLGCAAIVTDSNKKANFVSNSGVHRLCNRSK